MPACKPRFTIPAFSERAVRILHPLIDKLVEELELDFNEKYYGINVTTVLDVVDYAASKYVTFSDGKIIMRFKKYAFSNAPELSEYDILRSRMKLQESPSYQTVSRKR